MKVLNWFRRAAEPPQLRTLILFVTSRCDAKCATCFYWKELNSRNDLTGEELATVARTVGPLSDLWLSGGEPLLRKDLFDVVAEFVRHAGVKTVNLPVNGLHPDRTEAFVDRVLAAFPDVFLHCNVSVDGPADLHDRIRGVPGNFERALRTFEALSRCKDRWGRRLWKNCNTVVCADNLGALPAFAEGLERSAGLDGHYFNIIRGDAKDPALAAVPQERLPALYRFIAELQERYARRLFTDRNRLVRWFKQAAYVGTLTFQHRVQLANFPATGTWPMACTAGQSIAVIDHDGGVRACELRGRIANLRDFGCDFGRLWSDGARAAEVAAIERDKCFCSHICFIHDSLKHSRRAILREVPLAYAGRGEWS